MLKSTSESKTPQVDGVIPTRDAQLIRYKNRSRGDDDTIFMLMEDLSGDIHLTVVGYDGNNKSRSSIGFVLEEKFIASEWEPWYGTVKLTNEP